MDGGRNEYYKKILKRAECKGYDGDPILLLQDIEYADEVFDLRLSELLHATDIAFCHDIRCIMYYARKDKYPLTNYDLFIPKFINNKGGKYKMRTSKVERNENAKRFYNMFMNSNNSQAAIVVERSDSSNPNITRCKFWAVLSTLAFGEQPLVIAESTFGVDGCFRELLSSIKAIPQKSYFDYGFEEWLEKEYKFRISYKDGLVFMLAK